MNVPADSHVELTRRIHLTHQLGEGSMGRVFDGFAADLDQHVAVKILRPEHADDPEMRARFDEEIALLARLDHPGSPPIFGKGEDEQGLPCCVMKRIEGRTLADLLADRSGAPRGGPWRRHMLAILLDTCDTVAYAHEIGVIHRDIKPENILIDRHSSVYVIDWGIAKRLGDSTGTVTGKVMGSPGYMSPEQADGHTDSVGPQADVFALGAILYEILTGRRPFGGTGGREEMLASIHRDPKPPRRIDWSLPRRVSGICMKALHKDPAQRYADARSLAADLRAFLEGRLSLLERARGAARLHPLRFTAAAMLTLAALALLAGVAAQFWTDQRMAARAMTRVAELDAELVKTAAEMETARSQLDAPELDAARRAALTNTLQRLDARWIVTEFEALRLLASVSELRVIKVESELHPLARQRLFNLVRSLIERGQPALACGLIDTVLASHRHGHNALRLGEPDLAQLKQFARQAESRVIEQSRKTPNRPPPR